MWKNTSIVTVVGCGGDRDKGKRPLMGGIASELSDYCIFTEDNSRSEKAESICHEMTEKLKKDNWEIIPDRPQAIEMALKKLEKAVIIIAGKGEEEIIDRGYEKIPHKDKEYVEKIL